MFYHWKLLVGQEVRQLLSIFYEKKKMSNKITDNMICWVAAFLTLS